MKTLSVRQPWASLLVSGIKDIENRSWAPNYKGKILIHASLAKVPKKFIEQNIIEQSSIIGNEQMFGNFPEFEEMTYSAILGYVTVDGDTDNSQSVWAEPVEHQWIIKDAYLFDEPITGVKGKLNLFNTPEIDEDNLPPAHKLVRRAPEMKGNCLMIPTKEQRLESILEDGMFDLEITDEIIRLVEKPKGTYKDGENCLKDIRKVTFETEKRKVTVDVEDVCYQTYIDEATGKTLKGFNWFMEEVDYVTLGIKLKTSSAK